MNSDLANLHSDRNCDLCLVNPQGQEHDNLDRIRTFFHDFIQSSSYFLTTRLLEKLSCKPSREQMMEETTLWRTQTPARDISTTTESAKDSGLRPLRLSAENPTAFVPFRRLPTVLRPGEAVAATPTHTTIDTPKSFVPFRRLPPVLRSREAVAWAARTIPSRVPTVSRPGKPVPIIMEGRFPVYVYPHKPVPERRCIVSGNTLQPLLIPRLTLVKPTMSGADYVVSPISSTSSDDDPVCSDISGVDSATLPNSLDTFDSDAAPRMDIERPSSPTPYSQAQTPMAKPVTSIPKYLQIGRHPTLKSPPRDVSLLGADLPQAFSLWKPLPLRSTIPSALRTPKPQRTPARTFEQILSGIYPLQISTFTLIVTPPPDEDEFAYLAPLIGTSSTPPIVAPPAKYVAFLDDILFTIPPIQELESLSSEWDNFLNTGGPPASFEEMDLSNCAEIDEDDY